jgi:hypothetical protein
MHNQKKSERPLRRIALFNEAVMFFTKGGWIGLKLKDTSHHMLVGFTPAGMSVHKTIENPKTHIPLADVSNEAMEHGLGGFFQRF